jgi:siroheme synthase-like protein
MDLSNPLYPIFLKLKHKKVLVIGGGLIALQKLQSLINTEAELELIAPIIIPEIYKLEGEFPQKRKIKFTEREYFFGDELGAFLVIAATELVELNRNIANRCRDQMILVNSVDDPENCDFYVPSIIDSGAIKVAISTNGHAPSIAQKIRLNLQKLFDKKYAPLIPRLNEFREKVKSKISDPRQFNRRAKLIRWFTDRLFKKRNPVNA